MNKVPDGWKEVLQSDAATFYNGRAYKLTEWENSGTPVIRLQNLTGSGKDYYYSNLVLPEHQYCVKGDLLYMWSASFGPYIWQGGKAIFHYHIWKIECKKELLEQKFLYFLLDDITMKMMNQSNGSTMLHITKEGMEKLKISLPPLSEQKKISEILSSVDRSIEATEKLIAKLADLKKALMQELFTKGIGHTRFKNSPLGRIPEEWEVACIGDIASKVGSGITPRGGSEVYLSKGVKFLRSQNIYPNGLKLDDIVFISKEQHDEMKNSKLQSFDVLLNITGASIGRCYFVPEGFGEGNVNQHVCIIRCKEIYHYGFLLYFLNSEVGQGQIFSSQSGGSREGLNYEQIKSFVVPFPSLTEQLKIASILSANNVKIEKAQLRLNKLQDMKKGLMSDLLTGKVRTLPKASRS